MSTDSEVVVVATWRVRDGELESVLGLLRELRKDSLAEPGCASYEAHRSFEDARNLVLVERYRNCHAVEAHVESEHFQRLVIGAIAPLLETRSVVRLGPLF